VARNNAIHGALSGLRIVCIPVADEADELVALMVGQLLGPLGCEARQLPVAPRANALNELVAYAPQIAILSALPPFAAGQARSLCKRLRQRRPDLKIIVGLWNFEGGTTAAQDRIGPGVADMVVTSLEQAVSGLIQCSRGTSGEVMSPATRNQEIVVATQSFDEPSVR
jgi:hypothetical protein